MKMRFFHVAVMVAMTASAAAQAQTQKIKPGLWEHSVALKTQSGQIEAAMTAAQAQMAAMPPEQRKMVEQMRASRGMSRPGKASTMRVCVSTEQAEHDELPQNDHCKQQSMQRSGNTVKIKFNCDGTPPASGEAEFTVKSATAYSGKALVNTVVQGQPEQIQMDLTGTWLGADCGQVQPAGH